MAYPPETAIPSILEHKWGESKAADQVWSLVAGMAPAMADKVCVMVLQAYIDESFDHEEGVFVLGGYVSPVGKWSAFAPEWEEILPYAGLRDEDGQYYFKMSSLAARDGGIARSQAFFNIIDRHCELPISVMFYKKHLENAIARLDVTNITIDWNCWRNPYTFAFGALLGMFHQPSNLQLMDRVVSEKGPVDFIFDDRSDKAALLAAWDSNLAIMDPATRKLYGASSVFRDEKKYLPLQAADFWVWWRRKWYENNESAFTFADWNKGKRKDATTLEMSFTEDEIVNSFVSLIRAQYGQEVTIFDRATGLAV